MNGRVRFLAEGDYWNAYHLWEYSEEMFLLGSVHLGAIQNKERRQEFVAFILGLVEDAADDCEGNIAWSDFEQVDSVGNA